LVWLPDMNAAATPTTSDQRRPRSPSSQAAPEPSERRPRGRPRKTVDERDDGNRRRKLIAKAARLFRQKGFAATSTREIAAAVGAPGGAPLHLIQSKKALLLAAMETGMQAAIEQQHLALEEVRPGAADPRAVLKILIRVHLDVLFGPASDFIAVMLQESRSLMPRQRAQLSTLHHHYAAAWELALGQLHASGQLRTSVSVARLLIFGALNGALQWFEPEQGLSLDELTEAVLASFVGPQS